MTDTSPHQTPEQRTTQQIVPSINPKPTHKEETKNNPKFPDRKMKRNEPCFCNSGKKFKHCHGAL